MPRVLVFSGDRLWMRPAEEGRLAPAGVAASGHGWTSETLSGPDDMPWTVFDAGGEPPPAGEGLVAVGLRELHDLAAPALYDLAQQAFQLLHWRRTHRFCGACGAPLRRKPGGERAMRCAACRLDFFPRLNPVTITRVTRGDEILLARRATGATAFFSVIAGYVEAGETLEGSVAREIREETGVEVRDIRYFASQPWPFPNNLMIAFTAEHAAGEARADGVEIAETGWFQAGSLPPLPHPVSISRRLIDDFVAGRGAPPRGAAVQTWAAR